MNLLDNELVKKYFGEDRPGAVIPCDEPRTFNYEHWIAANVLKAMQEPLKVGELYLSGDGDGFREYECTDPFPGMWHPYMMRLPDRFQKKGGECWCGSVHRIEERKLLEEKINEICHKNYDRYLEPDLRSLVLLAIDSTHPAKRP